MAIHLNCSEKTIQNFPENQPIIHYMPCEIKADGPANVSRYFKPIDNEKDPKFKKASFRGRPLHGEEISLPAGYRGLVVQEAKQPLVENVERTMHVSNMFDRLTYWNWDKIPSANDPFISALSWIDISEALHSPIESTSD
ncbi:Ribonuclease H2 subunit C [Frankliniella fusca]|uniref:Ribonuclease H2 subunit C n=1 Tax=Frankliniella fusca TaxID=407009 RepID=A0AAE1HPJ9_9NEOP|nr:Ribonuclease H2 subunit C [Frankliniella fusca]